MENMTKRLSDDQHIKLYLVIAVVALLFSHSLSQTPQKYLLLKAGLHFDSNVSGGKYSPAELADIIDRNGLDVGIITDHDNMKVTYGIRPFEQFLKFSIEENSVKKHGFERYIGEINALDQMYKNLILIPGIEAVPYYQWSGSPMLENLKLKNWHTHLLVFGIDDPAILKNIPSVANGLGYKRPSGQIMKYISENFMHFGLIALYFMLFLIALLFIIRRKRDLVDIGRIRHHRRRYRFSFLALVIAAILGLILYQQYPWLPPRYTPYDAEPGIGPFQVLIDYVNANKGLVFWAHPEVAHDEKRPVNIPLLSQTISISTEAYPHHISDAQNYTGFAIFWEGMKVVGKPGGLWDMVLNEFCNGIRTKPVWAVGELDFEEANELSNVTETSTFIFARERTRAAVYEAMRAGRMYTTRGHFGNKAVLEDFSVYDMYSGRTAFIGETLPNVTPPVAIHVRIRPLVKLEINDAVLLYRNRELIKKFRFTGALDEWFVDEEKVPAKMYYYRIFLGENWPTLASNPIFVSK